MKFQISLEFMETLETRSGCPSVRSKKSACPNLCFTQCSGIYLYGQLILQK